VILRKKDPASMDGEARLREIASLLARGYLRLISSRAGRNSLDGPPTSEAHSACVVNGKRTRITSEVA